MPDVRNSLYRLFISKATRLCYAGSLSCFPPGSRILDVGIGNGIMMKAFHEVIKAKNLHITGIDINRAYLDHCRGLIRELGLQRHITIRCQGVERFRPLHGRPFDFILFSMSFMLLLEPAEVLARIRGWLRPGGRVVFFQTMFHGRSALMDFVKPRLKYLTTVDFGRVMYDHDFFRLLDDMDLVVMEDRIMGREWFGGEYRLIVTAFAEGKDNPEQLPPGRTEDAVQGPGPSRRPRCPDTLAKARTSSASR